MTQQPTVISLTKKIPAHGEAIDRITLREPTAKDLMDCGLPFQVGSGGDAGGQMVIDAKAVGRLISTLGAIPTSSVDHMATADFMRTMKAVMDFFDEVDLAGS